MQPNPETSPAPLFIETLKIADGRFVDSAPHRERIKNTLAETSIRLPNLPAFRDEDIPADLRRGIVKCRCTYGDALCHIEYERYVPRPVHFLKLVENNHIDYHLKYADRTPLLQLLELRGACDDVLIVRHGEITDTSYSNILLFDGTRYVTPRASLLNGTKRRRLLEEGRIEEAAIRPSDLPRFQTLHLINAMLDIEDNISLPVSRILL